MEDRTSARPARHSVAIMDSDEEFEVYDYNLSRHQSRSHKLPSRKSAQMASEGVGQQRQAQAQAHNASHHEENSSSDGVISAGDGEDEPNGEGDNEQYEDDDEDEDENAPRHPYYTYGTEKADVHADSKLIYQRHRLDTQSEGDPNGSPSLLARSYTMPAEINLDSFGGLGRTPSLSSRRSRQSQKISIVPPPSSGHGKEPFPSLQDQAVSYKERVQKLADNAAADARDHGHHPQLPHEFKDPLLANQGVHGAGAGVGMGDGPGGFAKTENAVVSEVEAICDKIKHILDLRQAYMRVSQQCPGDNPKDDEDWKIYPDPPDPVWTEKKVRPPAQREDGALHSASSSLYISDPKSVHKDGSKWGSSISMAGLDNALPDSPTTAKKKRKAGTHIGEDFDIDDCDIPGRAIGSLSFGLDQGSVYQVYDENNNPIVSVPTLRDYYMALDEILDIASDGPAKSFAYRRLQYLEGRYSLYTLLNEYEEVAETKKVPHRDFYNVRKVDTHVHHSACMNQKHLLRFIKSKMKKSPDDIVIDRDGKKLTLREVFESINLTAYDLSIDTLDMHAHTDSFHRFDKFNLKYNPIGQSRLRDIFLKTDNFIKGRYLAEITREVISDLESSKYQMVEWRISIYGRNINEWDKLAAWVVDNKLLSHNVRWLIQIPRLFAVYKAVNNMDNFEELIRNIFQPLFEVTMDPTTHPKLHIFLQRVIGFDSVDDESKVERRFYRKFPSPKDWNTKQNPPYGYWIYYLFANMTSLNAWRKRRGFNTFLLRPHCGEAGDTDHLAAAILCCHSISHGITLRKVPMLQYIFYLDQIGVAMSPLSNNALFLTYDRNPFISYFKKGLNVSLSTDDPLQFAFTKEPLIEEYSVAAQIYKLSAVDMCELAKHSVDQCGFELKLKQRWLGKYCYLPGVLGNDVRKGNVPDIREAFRYETLKGEHHFIARYTADYTHLERCTPTMPDPSDPSTATNEIYKALESPRQYYSTIVEPLSSAQLARNNSGKPMDFAILTKQVSPRDTRDVNTAGGGGGGGRLSRSSTISKTTSHADQGGQQQDMHISASEPRAFPGFVHEREKRRNSLRTTGSMSYTAREGSFGSERDREKLGTTILMEPGFTRARNGESDRVKDAEESERASE